MLKLVVFCSTVWGLILLENVKGRPEGMEDLKTGAMFAVAAIKEAVDNGAGAHDEKEIDMFGLKMKNKVGIGFGDVMKNKRPRSDSFSESDESNRRKRSASIENINYDMSEDDETDDIGSELTSQEEDDMKIYTLMFSSSSYSSSEDDDVERRKRSATVQTQIINNWNETPSAFDSDDVERSKRAASLELLANDIMNIYKN